MGKLISVGGGGRGEVEALAGQVAGWLHEREVQVACFSLPTRGPVGVLLRLQAQSRLRLDPFSLALLWTADRLDLLSREGGILAQLAVGTTVICAHYAWSGLSPVLDESIDLEWLERINARCVRPDLTLRVDGEQGLDCCQQQIAALLWPGAKAV